MTSRQPWTATATSTLPAAGQPLASAPGESSERVLPPATAAGLLGPGRGVTFLLVSLLCVGWLTACFVYLVHQRSQTTLLGYQIADARERLTRLHEQNERLHLEAREWQTPARLQLEAAQSTRLRPPSGSQARFLAAGASQDLLRQGQLSSAVVGAAASGERLAIIAPTGEQASPARERRVAQ